MAQQHVSTRFTAFPRGCFYCIFLLFTRLSTALSLSLSRARSLFFVVWALASTRARARARACYSCLNYSCNVVHAHHTHPVFRQLPGCSLCSAGAMTNVYLCPGNSHFNASRGGCVCDTGHFKVRGKDRCGECVRTLLPFVLLSSSTLLVGVGACVWVCCCC